jgi:hypothetical protein
MELIKETELLIRQLMQVKVQSMVTLLFLELIQARTACNLLLTVQVQLHLRQKAEEWE